MFGYYLKPNHRLRKAIGEAQKACRAALEGGNKGVYRTIVTDHNQSSELTVEVQELAVTQAGQVKVAYTSAFYKNPEFRNKKGEALLREVRDLLGDYLPYDEVAWYETTERQERLGKTLSSLDNLHNQHLGA